LTDLLTFISRELFRTGICVCVEWSARRSKNKEDGLVPRVICAMAKKNTSISQRSLHLFNSLD
jgi:hypothetical protein